MDNKKLASLLRSIADVLDRPKGAQEDDALKKFQDYLHLTGLLNECMYDNVTSMRYPE